MENKPITANELKEAFYPLKTNKSAGYDDISYNVVKNCFGELCDPLLYIFNLSSSSGIFPGSLKIEKVTPIYKAGESSDLSNYRQISVLPCFSKIEYIRTYKKIKLFTTNNTAFKQGTMPIMLSFNCYIKFMKILKKINIC